MNKKHFGFLLLLLALAACHRNPLDISVSKIELTLNIKRLDKDLYTVTNTNIKDMVPVLRKNYDPFFEIYNKEVLAIGDSRDSLYAGYLLSFLQDSVNTKARLKSDSVFHNFEPYASQLELAFKHYHFYYPELPVPTVYTYISGFNQSIVTAPGALGISLDNFLGSSCKFYRQLGLFEYKRRNMEPEKMVYDAMLGWATQQFEYKCLTEDLVSGMIHQGKLLYFLDAMMPDGRDSLKIGYTKDQLKWCKDNESQMWSYLIERKMLFSEDRMTMVRFINPAPFTSPFGQKSPGRTGVWLGWQIVRSYMDKNRGVNLKSLMKENDYHKILNDSGYSPE
jgi:gliding motility-associated lipoprotein GldB